MSSFSRISLAILLFVAAIVFCLRIRAVRLKSKAPPRTVSAALSPTPITSSQGSCLRQVDFANFTYPVTSGNKKHLQLKKGKSTDEIADGTHILSYLDYGDVTGDAIEEAIVVLGISVRGSAVPHVVYIYACQANAPKLLWSFPTGDRGSGGLRQVWADKGELVVDLYGENKIIGKKLFSVEDRGVCCPTKFTRSRYKWNDGAFQIIAPSEALTNPDTSAKRVMPKFHN